MNERPETPAPESSDPETNPSSGSSGGRPPVNPVRSAPPPPPPGYAPMAFAPPKQRGVIAKAFGGVLVSVFLFSLIMNVYLAGLIVSMSSGLTESEYQKGDKIHRIVIVPVRGLINDSTSSFIHDAFAMLREDKPAAVILRVDSGGGLVSPSDRIWREIVMFKKETGIPVIASFGSVAASGGYYISASCDEILAEPTCITGSIGVMAQAFTVDQLLNKIGITPEVLVATGSPKKDIANNIMRPWTEEDRDKLRTVLDHAHRKFVEVVLQGRGAHLVEEQVIALADGRIFTAEVAKNEKLIDTIGYLDDAIDRAKALAQLPAGVEPRVTVIGMPQSLLSSLTRAEFKPNVSQLDGPQMRQWVNEWATPQMLYLWQGR